ncbi:MAG: 50S ribosomal protein L5 [Candidatus Doudnabacteria bacterium]|nr:50S ribosomal protein L5 [Candidatus Doudnabacteria bacterium]
MARLLEQYKTKIRPALQAELKVENMLAVPRVEKIVVNAGIGRILQTSPKALDTLTASFGKITGQKPVARKAAKAISAFKIRQGQIVGLSVTLRGKRMYDFLDKLINVALPRTRDFRGVSKQGFDGHGNYSLGLKEHLVFPEMAQEESEVSFGLQVNIITTAKDDNSGYILLKKLGFPFKD